MVIAGSVNRVIVITGVDDKQIGNVSGVKDKIINGKFEFDDTGEIKDIVIGYTLADRIGVIKGDTIYLASSSGMDGGLLQFSMPKVLKFKLVGLFESDNKDYDNYYAYISLDAAKLLFESNYKGIDIRLDDINKSESVKQNLISQLPEDYVVSSWYDLHKDLYSIMKVERWIAYIILCLIIAVATFNILGSLTMTVMEKKRDIGILKSFGCSRKTISKIFILQGLLVGIIGTILGCLLGLAICILQIEFALFPLDPTVYIIPAMPVDINGMDFIYVAAASIIICFTATIYPSIRAAKMLPVEAIRWE
jgi:lipoprotein-releasing system permease protein